MQFSNRGSWPKIAIVLLALISLMGSANAGEVAPTYFGMHIGNGTTTTPWPQVQMGTVRTWDSGVSWAGIETSRGVYNWSALDNWMNLAEKHNVQLVYTFGHVPSWACGGCAGTTMPTNLQDWDDFVRAIVSHSAGRIKYWELWNEPNINQFWTGTIPQLVTLAQHAHTIIESVDPNAVILSPAPTAVSGNMQWQWLSNFWAAGGGNYHDVVAFHGYSTTTPEDVVYQINQVKNAMSQNGQSGKQLWDTEASWGSSSVNSTYTNSSQGVAFLARRYMLEQSNGVSRFIWYMWDNTAGWGTLWDKTNGTHVTGVAYGEMYKWLVGANASACAKASDGTWTCNLARGSSYQGQVIWNASAKTVAAPSQFRQYRTLSGGTYSIPANGSVSIGAVPILLQTGSPVAGQVYPTAVLSVTPTSGYAPLAVAADSSASSSSNGSISSRSISFGDGSAAVSTATASHKYNAAGTYTVTLSVTDSTGLTSKATQKVTVTAPISSSTAGVVVSSPGNGTTSASPLHVVASANGGSYPITTMRIYADYKSVYSVNAASLNTYVSLAAGSHSIIVQAWNSAGQVFKKSLTVTIK